MSSQVQNLFLQWEKLIWQTIYSHLWNVKFSYHLLWEKFCHLDFISKYIIEVADDNNFSKTDFELHSRLHEREFYMKIQIWSPNAFTCVHDKLNIGSSCLLGQGPLITDGRNSYIWTGPTVHCYKNDSLVHRVWIEVPTV